MHIAEILSGHRPTLSLEFFPPKTPAGLDRVFRIITQFEELRPDFVSVTYGAGGGTRAQTHELVRRIKTETQMEPVPHLTCVCQTSKEIDGILSRYETLGIGGIMALGGDEPRELVDNCEQEFEHAADFVRHIRRFMRSGEATAAGGFGVGVAGFPEGHPDTPNRKLEMDYLKAKVDSGADYICTQLFFDNHDFLDFRDRCTAAGISVPMIAGIMPIVSRANYDRIPSLALGSRYPADLIGMLQSVESDEEIQRIGIDWAQRQCAELLQHEVDGIHFYTLNRFDAVKEIWDTVRG